MVFFFSWEYVLGSQKHHRESHSSQGDWDGRPGIKDREYKWRSLFLVDQCIFVIRYYIWYNLFIPMLFFVFISQISMINAWSGLYLTFFLPISILPPPSLNYRANSLFFWLKDALCRKVKSLLKSGSLLLLPRLRTFPFFTFTVKLKWHYCGICLLLKPFIENSCKSFARIYPGKYYHLWEILRYVSIWLHQGIKPRNIDCTIWV